MKKTLLAALLVLAVVTSGCGYTDSETNEIGLVYSGGIIEDKTYKGVLKPGVNAERIGWGSKAYLYRTDQRTYIAGNTEQGADTPVPDVVSKDDVRLTVPYQLYFKLNLEPKTLRKFHENIGVKTEAWVGGADGRGWDNMLRDYFRTQVERSLEAAALQFNWRDLYATEEARVGFQNDAAKRTKEAITSVIGDVYFCGPAYDGLNEATCGEFTMTVGKPTPVDGGIIAAVEAEQTAATRNRAQEQENNRINTQLLGEKARVELYGVQGVLQQEQNEILREAAAAGNLNVFLGDDANRVVVPAPAAPARP